MNSNQIKPQTLLLIRVILPKFSQNDYFCGVHTLKWGTVCNPFIIYALCWHADNNTFTFTLNVSQIHRESCVLQMQNINIFTFVRKASCPVLQRCSEFHFVFCGLSYFTLTNLVCLFCMFSRVIALSMSPVDDMFISGSLDKTIRIWDLRSPNCQVSIIWTDGKMTMLSVGSLQMYNLEL